MKSCFVRRFDPQKRGLVRAYLPTGRVGTQILLFFIVVGILASCAIYQPSQRDLIVAFEQVDVRQYEAEVNGLVVQFRIEAGQFLWVFKNGSRRLITIDPQMLALRREDDALRYALWGERKQRGVLEAPLQIEPGETMQLRYPVRYVSPFYPFDLKSLVWLDLPMSKGGAPKLFRLVFTALP